MVVLVVSTKIFCMLTFAPRAPKVTAPLVDSIFKSKAPSTAVPFTNIAPVVLERVTLDAKSTLLAALRSIPVVVVAMLPLKVVWAELDNVKPVSTSPP